MISHEVIAGCIRKDRKSQFEFYKLTIGFMMSISRRYIKQNDQAKAVVNLAYLKVFTGIKDKKESSPVLPWIKRIMINTIIDEFRKENKKHLIKPEPIEDNILNTHITWSDTLEKMETESLLEMLHGIPPTTAKVFNLFAIDGYSHQEISIMLGISQGTSKWHVSDARVRLKNLLEKRS